MEEKIRCVKVQKLINTNKDMHLKSEGAKRKYRFTN